MSLAAVLLVVGGLVALVAGGEVLVRGASGIARSLGLSPLVVGLTVVALATSAPEMAVTVDAALTGNPGLALGNVVGSNIVNVLLVLGVTALLLPVAVGRQLVRSDIPFLIGISVLTLVLSLDGAISRLDGGILLVCALVYLGLAVALGLRHRTSPGGDGGERPTGRALVVNLVLVVVGVALLVVGARALVSGATDIARAFGVSDLVIGLTVVAIGTSLPELVTSLVAAVRRQRDMALGNIAGSCVLNLGAVLGVAGLLSPDGVPVDPAAIDVDLPFMVAVALVVLPLAFTGAVISRWEGAVLIGYYVAYTAYLLLDAGSSSVAGPFSTAMLLLVVPITVLWIAVLVGYELGRRRGSTSVTA